ncbi:MAG: hypothetical protein Q8M49_05515 [Limnobacter sp.]|nr:hypothetical protein [Limnobacter sp.]
MESPGPSVIRQEGSQKLEGFLLVLRSGLRRQPGQLVGRQRREDVNIAYIATVLIADRAESKLTAA